MSALIFRREHDQSDKRELAEIRNRRSEGDITVVNYRGLVLYFRLI